jgi:ribonuclease Z
MRPIFHPHLVNGSSGDPVLYVDCLFEHRALMFDLGDISALPPRKLMRVSHVFVSHAHMDHFIGFDGMLRILLGRDRDLHLFGPPGFLAQVEHKLSAYTWNLVQNYESDFTLRVTELDETSIAKRASFHCRKAFQREQDEIVSTRENILLDEPAMKVRYTLLDHGGIACLAYMLEENAHVNIWKNCLEEMGLPLGPWLRELKQAVLRSEADDTQIVVHWREQGVQQERVLTLKALKPALRIVPGQKIAYVTDVAWQRDNVTRITELARKADLLYIEAVFMERDSEHGQKKFHLTTRQAGDIARTAGAINVIPMHFSPRYQGENLAALREELALAFGGNVL